MNLYEIRNPTRAKRVIFDGSTLQRRIEIPAGAVTCAQLEDHTAQALMLTPDDLIIALARKPGQVRPSGPPTIGQAHIIGHRGIGDTIHQRGPLRELMARGFEVFLETPGWVVYHDLIEQGLKLIHMPTGLHAQARQIEREAGTYQWQPRPVRPQLSKRVYYNKPEIDRCGSIAQAMYYAVGLPIPEKPDFSMPVRHEWKDAARRLIASWNTDGKPICIYRPITLRPEWNGKARNPDHYAYHQLFKPFYERFFVVSVAFLRDKVEWIEGGEQFAHVKLHAGELSTQEMIGLWKEAHVVYANAGFGPVMAQAVGTPCVTIYGGRESYRTTERAGAHLAPTLGIDPDQPCDCHSGAPTCGRCNKYISIAPAADRISKFVDEHVFKKPIIVRSEPRQVIAEKQTSDTLIFGTFYVDSPDRENLTDLWIKLHTTINPDCDFLAVDSQSPAKKFQDWTPYDGERHKRMYFNFPDNIGHLSRRGVTKGRDGWGRAFCKGLEIAVALNYSHVVHIEGDSLFRMKVADVVERMKREGAGCFSTGVHGMRIRGSGHGWVETGLMFFETAYVRNSDFIRRYDWPNRQHAPTPEVIVRNIIGNNLIFQDRWRALRADKNQITKDNITTLDLDWVTHQHNSDQQPIYQKFVEMALGGMPCIPAPASTAPVAPATSASTNIVLEKPSSATATPLRTASLLRLNLGCGMNRINGWQNHDSDVDIRKPLPWPDASASHIFIEHCVEHVDHKAAIAFFKEVHRVLAPGGVLRVTVPSLEMIRQSEDLDYFRFTTKWQKQGPTKRGAMEAIIYAHGHEMIWCASLMEAALFYSGFDLIEQCQPGKSKHQMLTGVEGHGKVIGDRFNAIESLCFEATKQGVAAPAENIRSVAIIIGGAINVDADVAKAEALCRDYRLTPEYFYTNDKIADFPGIGVAVTLHPDRLPRWMQDRRNKGLPEPTEIWCNRQQRGMNLKTRDDWRGSVGLFGVACAKDKGHDKILLCGIPMTMDAQHYLRRVQWPAAGGFQAGWRARLAEIAPFVRSLSGGWTEELLGAPTPEWLGLQQAAVAA